VHDDPVAGIKGKVENEKSRMPGMVTVTLCKLFHSYTCAPSLFCLFLVLFTVPICVGCVDAKNKVPLFTGGPLAEK
jgi:hypothetical protein